MGRRQCERQCRIDFPTDGHPGSFTCGVLYLGSRDIPKAREDFKKAVELNPNNVEAHYELGWLYTDYKPVYARQELEKALKLNPSHSGAKKELERLNNKNK